MSLDLLSWLSRPVSFIMGSAVLNTVAQVLIKQGLSTVPDVPFWEWALRCMQNFFILGGILCYAVSLVLWLLGLAKVDISYGLPLLSISYVLTFIAGAIFFKDPINALKITGIFLILGGIYCVARSGQA